MFAYIFLIFSSSLIQGGFVTTLIIGVAVSIIFIILFDISKGSIRIGKTAVYLNENYGSLDNFEVPDYEEPGTRFLPQKVIDWLEEQEGERDNYS